MKNYQITSILIFLSTIISCKNKPNSENKVIEEPSKKFEFIETTNSGCPKIKFHKKLDSTITLKGFYYECEDLWKQNIEFKFNGKTIYKTKALNEYQFQEYLFPVLIKNGDLTEILLERDDRPSKNFLEVFRFQNYKLDSIYKIPYFESKPKDLDKDENDEFYATLNHIESFENGKIGYNPILAYEITKEKLMFDLEATKIVNEKVYGKFYGLRVNDTLKFNGKEIENNWP